MQKGDNCRMYTLKKLLLKSGSGVDNRFGKQEGELREGKK